MDSDLVRDLSPTPPGAIVASSVIVALAASEGIDLLTLALPVSQRPPSVANAGIPDAPRMLAWKGASPSGVIGPRAARRFFEEFELFPGLVVRGWNHPAGRLGFGLDGRRVTFELHVQSAGLLIRGDPETVTFALQDVLPETVCMALVGKPLERLVAWPPARGPDYVVISVETVDGVQVVTLSTSPISIGDGDVPAGDRAS